jgi:hypothetical protein
MSDAAGSHNVVLTTKQSRCALSTIELVETLTMSLENVSGRVLVAELRRLYALES